MTKLTDTQAILLSTAAQRKTGSLYPLPTSLRPGGGVAKALAALVERRLAEERETTDPAAVHRGDGDALYGLFVTAAGLAAIGVEPDGGAAIAPLPAPAARVTKADTVVALLRRAEGATLAELIAATSWLPHTTRAALTGLRKKGHAIERSKRGNETCYRVAA